MVDTLLVQDFLLVVLLWLVGLLYEAWLRHRSKTVPTTRTPAPSLPKPFREPKPFAGLTHQPRCTACEQTPEPGSLTPRVPPVLRPSSLDRLRQVDTTTQFCPQPRCANYGWVGLGNIRAHGYPNGGRWRQPQCLGCKTYFLETYGTPLHGKRVAPEVVGWAVGRWPKGWGSGQSHASLRSTPTPCCTG